MENITTIKDLRTVKLIKHTEEELEKGMAEDLVEVIYLRDDVNEDYNKVDKLIKEGDNIIINILYGKKEGIQGKVIINEPCRKNTMHRILFQSIYHKPDQYDVLYLNGSGVWQTENPDGLKIFLESYFEEFEEDGNNNILNFILNNRFNIKLKDTTTIKKVYDDIWLYTDF